VQLLSAHQIETSVVREPIESVLAAPATRPHIVLGHLSEGFRLPDERVAFVTESDLFGEVRQRRRRRPIQVGALLKSLSELKRDDYVVHLDHGVGLYRGLKHMQVGGTEGDYLQLEYAGGDRLYIPADRINVVQRYVGADGAAPPLDKLGGTSWEKAKKKTRESILAMAKELLEIYATREILERRAYTATDDYFSEFEARFPFEETEDQEKAIAETLADMGKPRPMDRLICGDVGYGKTEVAMRAAFLAVLEGRQVAVLVPTTVLAQQHLQSFRKRFEGYPVRVEALSRLQTKPQVDEILRGLRAGTVDVVVSTHRLLQPDIEFKQLGLLIVDEEHRFGVKDKERVKQMRKLVDVLTLTATPIPRTLQMGLVGIRDLSVIETPPVDRQAIRTYVTRYDEGLVRESIQRELDRQGQVFFVHNRVETIEAMVQRIRGLVPNARVAVAHGQMKGPELERVMLAFMECEVDVLVCSAIIESGLDIPNANTMIINRADTFGLAQLYQLRGRVGRSHQRAYAYLMIPGEHLITKDAQKRLKVLQELDELGGGFRLAAHDLEIRGAGNLLGKQQSGHVAAVGFEMYEQMLAEAVRELRGERLQADVEPEMQLGIPAFIPETYIPDEQQRLAIYRRLAAIRNDEELEDLTQEMRERFGPLPPAVDSFVRLMDLRRHLRAHQVIRCVRRDDWITLQFHPDAPVEVDTLLSLVQQHKKRFKLSKDFQLSFQPKAQDWDGIVGETKDVLARLATR
jgi:transcription-repair coupling factor (superfamily II helicase)